MGDSYSQNAKTLPEYCARLGERRLPIQRGYRLHDDDRLRRDVINQLMCHGRVDFAVIEAAHGIRFTDYFAGALAALAEPVADGLVTLDDNALTLHTQGRLMMRNVAMAFDAYLGEQAQQGRFSRTI